MLDIARHRSKTLKKNEKSEKVNNNKYFFTFTFL